MPQLTMPTASTIHSESELSEILFNLGMSHAEEEEERKKERKCACDLVEPKWLFNPKEKESK